jgi:hypothetical protein
MFDLSLRQIQRIVAQYNNELAAGKTFPNLLSKSITHKGPISELTEELMECILEFNSMEGYRLPIRQFTLRFNEVYGTTFHFSTMQKYSKLMSSVMKTSHVKPRLKDIQKLRRLDFVLNRLEPVENGVFRIRDMRNKIHVDEKWFYVMRTQRKIRVLPEDPRQSDQETHHKSHVEKLLFLAAVGVPQFAPDGTWFDGKIGVWLIPECTVA